MAPVGLRFQWVLCLCSSLFAEVHSAKLLAIEEDTTSSVQDERQWFKAEDYVRYLEVLAEYIARDSAPYFQCIDLFGASGKVRKSWQSKGYRAVSYDIKLNKDHDVTTFEGCVLLFTYLLKLTVGGMVVCGPPCSLMVGASQSVHQRSFLNLLGNTANLRVRCANRIWLNFGIVLMVLHRLRQDICILVEQPSSSWAFRLPIMERVRKIWSMHRVTTHMGCFGHDLCKCSHFMVSSTFRNGDDLARTMTATMRLKVQKRFLKRQARRNHPKEYYKKHSNGSWSGGKHLAHSAEYRGWFVNAVRAAWISQSRPEEGQ